MIPYFCRLSLSVPCASLGAREFFIVCRSFAASFPCRTGYKGIMFHMKHSSVSGAVKLLYSHKKLKNS